LEEMKLNISIDYLKEDILFDYMNNKEEEKIKNFIIKTERVTNGKPKIHDSDLIMKNNLNEDMKIKNDSFINENISEKTEIETKDNLNRLNTNNNVEELIDEKDLCVICLNRKINTVNIPCGHMAECENCSVRFINANCPICRTNIVQIVKTYKV